MTETYDYSEFQEERAGDNSLASLRELAAQQIALEEEVGVLEAQLAEKREQLRVLSEHKLPELMDEIGVDNFSTSSGLKVAIKETVFTSMGRTDEEKGTALDWLEDNGHGALIKRVVEVPFGRGQDKEAILLAKSLLDEGRVAHFARKVEPMTLKAFVTEELDSGREIPLDIFKVERKRVSRIQVGK